MAKRISILEEVELSTGASIYVQINDNRGSLSLDNPETQYSIRLEVNELEALRDAINKALEDANA